MSRSAESLGRGAAGAGRLALGALVLLVGCPTPDYVYPPGAPEIARFDLLPRVVDAGQSITIRWRTRDATTVHIAGLDATPRSVDAEGETTFTPTDSGDLELIATSAGGERRARATFMVRSPQPVQVVTLTAEPRLVRPGEAVTIRWQTENATRIRVRTSAGVALYDGDLARGGVTFRPQRGVEVALVAEGFMGPVTSAVFVSTEEGLPFIHTFVADPPIASSQDEVRLAWLTSRASEVELFERIDDAWVSIATSPATSQTVWFPLEALPGTRTFRLDARNATGSVSSQATSVVLGVRQPQILTFTATPAVTGFGGTVRVAWEVVEARDVVLTHRGDIGGLPFTAERDLTIYSTGNVTLTARDDFGASTATTTTVVVDSRYPEVQQFSIAPSRISLGDSVLIRTTVFNADRYDLYTEDGTWVSHDNGTAVWTPDRSTVLTLVATSSFGTTIARAWVAVNERPTIDFFEVDDRVVRRNRPTRVAWRSSGGIRAVLRINGLASSVTPDEDAVRTAFSVASLSTLAFELTAPSGSVESATATVSVLDAVTGAGVEVEPNGTAATAHVLDASFEPLVTGALDVDAMGASDVDWFAIDARTGRRLALTTAPQLGTCRGLVVTVFGEGDYGEPIGPFATSPDDGGCPTMTALSFPGLGDLGRIALVRVERPAALAPQEIAEYALGVTVESRVCGDGVLDRNETCDDGNTLANDGCDSTCHEEGLEDDEPNHLVSLASPLTVGTPVVGSMAPEDRDLWRFDVGPDQEGPYRIDLSAAAGACDLDVTMKLLDPNGGSIFERSTASGCVTLDGPFLVLGAGRYHVRIDAGSGAIGRARGRYRLLVAPIP